jgi:hypothetical protein
VTDELKSTELCESQTIEKFSWDKVYMRRRVLADAIRRRIELLSFPFGVTEPFDAVPLIDQFLADQPMWRVPFYVIAHIEMT